MRTFESTTRVDSARTISTLIASEGVSVMLPDELIDKRIVERNIERGRLDAAEYRRMLAELPDVSGKIWNRAEAESRASASVMLAKPEREPASASEPALDVHDASDAIDSVEPAPISPALVVPAAA